MKNIKQNRKGQFFSIGTFLLILVLILIFSYSSIHREKTESFQVQRLKTAVMSNFVEEFEEEYVYKIFETAAKPSMMAYLDDYSAPLDFDEFTGIMKNGQLNGNSFHSLQNLNTDSTLRRILSTVTFSAGVEPEFTYALERARMISNDKMNLSFVYNYSFKSDGSVWSNRDVKIELTINVYSLNHPFHRQIINNYWVPDAESVCLARQIFVMGDNCGYNMKPYVPPALNPVP